MTSNIYGNLIAQFDRIFRHNRQGSFKTKERYGKAMKRFCRFLAERYRLEKLANIAPKHVFAYVDFMKGKGLSASTIKTELSAIRFWHDMMPNARHTLPDNSEISLERRSFGRIDRTWTNAEFHKMMCVCLEHNREDYLTALCLARYAGLRIHECFRIDTATAANAVKAMEITIKGKGGKVRTVPINESIKIMLEKRLAVTERGRKLLVPEGVLTHRAINNLEQFICAHRHEVQEPDALHQLTFHGLRHTYAQEQYLNLLKSGGTRLEAERGVSRLLGHERPEVTRIYLAGLEAQDV